MLIRGWALMGGRSSALPKSSIHNITNTINRSIVSSFSVV
jgi:hypothetical protein